MPADKIPLAAADVMELGQLLAFIDSWLTGAERSTLTPSRRRFVGTDGYNLDELRADCLAQGENVVIEGTLSWPPAARRLLGERLFGEQK